MKRIAIYPGTFDPITLGHLDVIKTSSAIFDEVVVGLLINPTKKPLFTKEERLMLVEEVARNYGLRNVRVKYFDGLAVELARHEKATVIIRGLRLTTEYEAELNICFNNQNLDEAIHTTLLPPLQRHVHISSSAVRELISFGQFNKMKKYVPPPVLSYIFKKLKR